MGSGLFLCAQILMLLDFVVAWNDSWVDKEDERCSYSFLFSLQRARDRHLLLRSILARLCMD